MSAPVYAPFRESCQTTSEPAVEGATAGTVWSLVPAPICMPTGASDTPCAGSQARIPEIIHAHRHHIVAGFYGVGDVEFKTGVAALVFANALAVHEHFRHLKHAVEIKVDAFSLPVFRHGEMFAIPADAHVKS